jgi:hypothetical protein
MSGMGGRILASKGLLRKGVLDSDEYLDRSGNCSWRREAVITYNIIVPYNNVILRQEEFINSPNIPQRIESSSQIRLENKIYQNSNDCPFHFC